jgi:chromosome segregation ATPase
VRITEEQRRQTEQRIRAAMERLLGGDLAAGGRSDLSTLAAEAGVSRNTLYTTYTHLKDEFETRRERLRYDGAVVDPRSERIDRLAEEVTDLRRRVQDRDTSIRDLTEFKTIAVSRLAAQHDEITRLRVQLASHGNVSPLRRRGEGGPQ